MTNIMHLVSLAALGCLLAHRWEEATSHDDDDDDDDDDGKGNNLFAAFKGCVYFKA